MNIILVRGLRYEIVLFSSFSPYPPIPTICNLIVTNTPPSVPAMPNVDLQRIAIWVAPTFIDKCWLTTEEFHSGNATSLPLERLSPGSLWCSQLGARHIPSPFVGRIFMVTNLTGRSELAPCEKRPHSTIFVSPAPSICNFPAVSSSHIGPFQHRAIRHLS